MSYYLNFYIAYKNKEGKLESALYDHDKKPACIYWRSRGYVEDIDEYRHEWNTLTRDMVADDFAQALGFKEDDEFNFSDYTYTKINRLIGQHGFKNGWLTLDELDAVTNMDDYDAKEFLRWNTTLKSHEYVASLPEDEKRDYAKYAYVDTASNDYINSLLFEVCESLSYVPAFSEGLYIIFWGC